MPVPKDATAIKSFVGMVSYYSRFVPNLQGTLEPLYKCLRSKTPEKWGKAQDLAFKQVKSLLAKADFISFYDPSKPLILSVDASNYGVGAVIAHTDDKGNYRPIYWASAILNSAQRNYSQLDKEAYAIVFGVKRFHQFLFGRHFTIETDHKPLESIFGNGNPKNVITAARMARWSSFLSGYNFSIKFVSGSANVIADALSRLIPNDSTAEDVDVPEDVDKAVFHLQLGSLPLSKSTLLEHSKMDDQFSAVRTAISSNWKSPVDPRALPFRRHKNSLSSEGEFILLGDRVVIPSSLRKSVLDELHAAHSGVVRMKSLARSLVYWPNIDSDIEALVRQCTLCQKCQSDPPKDSSFSWPTCSEPWGRVHIDFAGPFFDKYFLLGVDSKTKFPEITMMSRTTAQDTIDVLSDWFSRHGFPLHIHSDSGPQFTSSAFAKFLSENGIRHTRSAPYHPATNGAVEGFVKTFKNAFKKLFEQFNDKKLALSTFLLNYRTTPHSTTGTPPFIALNSRPLRTRLHLLNPRSDLIIRDHDPKRTFSLQSAVLTRDYRGGKSWVSGIITKILTPVTYLVEVAPGVLWKRHSNQIISRDPNLPLEHPSFTSNFRHIRPPQGQAEENLPERDQDIPGPNVQPVPRRSQRTPKPVDHPDMIRYSFA